jgi:SAM-dependent methyltransferase
MSQREFDKFSQSYEELLKDPVRDAFTVGNSEFFHVRKYDLIRAYLRRRGLDGKKLSYLDVGCGKGELASMLSSEFGRVAGCDPSTGMLRTIDGFETREQQAPDRIPFGDREFDLVTAVCVYHHVPPGLRGSLTREVSRVLKPGGVFCIIEHNPYNPATRLIVNRTPVDADAILLRARETRAALRDAGFAIDEQRYFLYLPEPLYKHLGWGEDFLSWLPLGGQYAVFGRLQP